MPSLVGALTTGTAPAPVLLKIRHLIIRVAATLHGTRISGLPNEVFRISTSRTRGVVDSAITISSEATTTFQSSAARQQRWTDEEAKRSKWYGMHAAAALASSCCALCYTVRCLTFMSTKCLLRRSISFPELASRSLPSGNVESKISNTGGGAHSTRARAGRVPSGVPHPLLPSPLCPLLLTGLSLAGELDLLDSFPLGWPSWQAGIKKNATSITRSFCAPPPPKEKNHLGQKSLDPTLVSDTRCTIHHGERRARSARRACIEHSPPPKPALLLALVWVRFQQSRQTQKQDEVPHDDGEIARPLSSPWLSPADLSPPGLTT